jgi:hypothetical protein
MTTVSNLGSVTYSVTSRHRPLSAVVVTSQAMPPRSVLRTLYVVSRPWTSVKVRPSVTMKRSDWTLVLSIVGLYTSDSTPPATVYQTFESRFAAVPRQSLRARS